MMSRMAPTPIRTAPSSAPLEAMVAKQQTHIDELVTKNRGLEASVQKLQGEVAAEKARYEDALQKVKAQYDGERTKWREDSDMLQRLWRITYLREVLKVERAEKMILDMKDELRRASLATLQRDYQLEMFRAQELVRDDKIAELEDALEILNLDQTEAGAQFHTVEKERDSLREQLEARKEELHEAAEEKKQIEVCYIHCIPQARFHSSLTQIAVHLSLSSIRRKRYKVSVKNMHRFSRRQPRLQPRWNACNFSWTAPKPVLRSCSRSTASSNGPTPT